MLNDEDDILYPFKGPFKGKGANRRALKSLTKEIEDTQDQMKALLDRFDQVYPHTARNTRPLHLRVIWRGKHGYVMSWRKAEKSGSYFRLFGSEYGENLLRQFSQAVIRVLGEFERERLRLNFRMRLLWIARESYRVYQENSELLAKWTDQDLDDGATKQRVADIK